MIRILLASLLFLVPTLARADVKMDDATKKATGRALEWLAHQQASDGSFSDGGYVHNTAITGFTLLAFMANGHLPNQGDHGKVKFRNIVVTPAK